MVGPDDFKKIIDSMNKAVDDGTRQAAQMLWAALLSYLTAHWLVITIILFVLFVMLTLKAMLGQWGSLGSFIYNVLYFGTLLVIGLIWGPNIFLGDFFKAMCTAILYPICYLITGYILEKIGLGK